MKSSTQRTTVRFRSHKGKIIDFEGLWGVSQVAKEPVFIITSCKNINLEMWPCISWVSGAETLLERGQDWATSSWEGEKRENVCRVLDWFSRRPPSFLAPSLKVCILTWGYIFFPNCASSIVFFPCYILYTCGFR